MLTRADYAARHAKDEARLEQRQKFERWVEDQYKLCMVIDQPDDPTKLVHQLGRQMSRPEFEKIVKKMNPAIEIKPMPKKPNYCHVIWGMRRNFVTGQLEPNIVCNCENRFMPEFSLMERVEKEMPVMVDHFTRDTPAFETKYAVGGEIVRGWRTILINLVKAGAISIADVESYVGHANRPGWSNHLGRQKQNVLY